MKPILHFLAGALLVGASLPALADQSGPYGDLIKQVQQNLNDRGFDAGPVNGDFGARTQAALAQFQLANLLPASGMTDPRTMLELGVEHTQTFAEASAPAGRDSAAAGATGPAATSR